MFVYDNCVDFHFSLVYDSYIFYKWKYSDNEAIGLHPDVVMRCSPGFLPGGMRYQVGGELAWSVVDLR
ncbi:MAG: hypothetical protein K0R47_181 [Brevibacillus sp.]|jgi:hypothetical protein|nr:hypothetical protein [Brevibacillus sp.]